MKLDASNYYSAKANMEYMSVSQFKAFEKCEFRALEEARGKYKPDPTIAMLVGSYVDAFYEGTLDTFKSAHPQIFRADGELKADYVKAQQIISRTMRDRFFQKLMSGQKQVIMTGVIAGIKVKIKVDSLCPDRIVDLKVLRDFGNVVVDDRGCLPFFEAWEYDLQGAVYQEIVRQNIGKKLPFILACATKETVTDIDAIKIEQESLDFCLERFIELAPGYDAIKKRIVKPERCEKCDYCKLTKKLRRPTSSGDLYI